MGCGSSLGRYVWNPFRDRENTSYMTPMKRTRQLEQLAAETSKKSDQEQIQLAQDLTRQIQAEQDPLMREHLLTTIAALDTPLTGSVLQAALRDEVPTVRQRAVELIAAHQTTNAVGILAEVVKADEDLDVRLAATRELGRFKDRVAIEAVASGLDDDDPAMRFRTMESLAKMTDEDLGLNVVAWKQYLRGGPTGDEPQVAEKLRSLSPF
ncbi:MAG: HEAT repeat domain-containing protein [Planctomycetales bacterium]|nr:HEAT repeat domain-containing protein [Planctomycetales bacterium]